MQASRRFFGLSTLLGLVLTIAVVTTQTSTSQNESSAETASPDFLVLNPELD